MEIPPAHGFVRGNPAEMEDQKAMQELAEGATCGAVAGKLSNASSSVSSRV